MKTNDTYTDLEIANMVRLKKVDSSIYCNTIHIPKQYRIDFDKVTTLEDILLVLKLLNITISEELIIGIEHLVKEI